MKPELVDLANRIQAHGTTYRLATRWKVTCIVLGILCTLLVVLIPFGILMFILAGKARVVTADEGVVIKWIGTRVIRWEEFAGFQQMPFHMAGHVGGLGLAGALVAGAVKGAVSAMVSGPIQYTLTNKKSGNIAAHWMAGSVAMVDTFEQKTGMTIVPKKTAKAAA
ncbi:MAG: hypothetical protein U1F43_13695 [Myxococcota bacterium]